MSEIETLEAQLREHPDDWSSWLVYSDWLQDRGDVRGELISLEHKLSRMQLPDEHRALSEQRSDLIRRHKLESLEGYRALPRTVLHWRHGFVVGVWLPWEDRTLQKCAELASHPSGHLLSALQLNGNALGEVGAGLLARAERLRTLTTLDLYGANIGDAGAAALADSKLLSTITLLTLGANSIGDEGASALARSEHLSALTGLYLSFNRIGPRGASALAHSEHLRSLRSLNLSANAVGCEGAKALASSEQLRTLTRLHLQRSGIYADGRAALSRSDTLCGCKVSL